MLFCDYARNLILEQYPNMKTMQVSRELGNRWMNLPDAQKAPYEVLAQGDKLRYDNEVNLYVEEKAKYI